MIKIYRKKTYVFVEVDTNLDWVVPFKWVQSSELDAVLLERHLRDELYSRVEAIREEAYNQGWKDAKAKRKKQTWFWGILKLR